MLFLFLFLFLFLSSPAQSSGFIPSTSTTTTSSSSSSSIGTGTGHGGGRSRSSFLSMSSTSTSSKSLRDNATTPMAPLPPIILSNVPGTWAYDTMGRRVREEILGRIFEENDMDEAESLAPGAIGMMNQLVEELETPSTSVLKALPPNPSAPDIRYWNDIIMKPYLGQTWLDAPWLYTEFYLYRRVVEAFDYFGSGYDPFDAQKRQGVTSSVATMGPLAQRLLQSDELGVEAGIRLWVSAALWGNRMDLSLWPAGSGGHSPDAFSEVLAAAEANLLADDTSSVVRALSSGSLSRVDIIVDNAGFELFTDLCLADYLVQSGLVSKVVIQLKGHPTFVSDAMSKDLLWMINYLRDHKGDHKELSQVAERWQGRVDSGEWILKENLYWAQPQPFWEMPDSIAEELREESSLVFVKGDANYRRLLGDRTWPLDTPFSQVAGYFPAPVCALRTLKAELGCGMPPQKTDAAAALDDNWMVNGRFGCVQLFEPAACTSRSTSPPQ